jgi:hypothetical protein
VSFLIYSNAVQHFKVESLPQTIPLTNVPIEPAAPAYYPPTNGTTSKPNLQGTDYSVGLGSRNSRNSQLPPDYQNSGRSSELPSDYQNSRSSSQLPPDTEFQKKTPKESDYQNERISQQQQQVFHYSTSMKLLFVVSFFYVCFLFFWNRIRFMQMRPL